MLGLDFGKKILGAADALQFHVPQCKIKGSKMKTKFYDLTPRISPRLAVFPGDQPFERRPAMEMSKGAHLELSSMLTTLHLGAHADAPSHYGLNLPDISQRPLTRYMGKAQVIRVGPLQPKARVTIEDIRAKILAPRILIDTQSFPDPEVWNPQFNSFSPELLMHLADHGVELVGIDTPSVDPADSKALEAHHVLKHKNMSVLEGLLLKDVPEGIYSLIALPLPIEKGDASPVRAVLVPHTQVLDELE
jgi:arylformamidase